MEVGSVGVIGVKVMPSKTRPRLLVLMVTTIYIILSPLRKEKMVSSKTCQGNLPIVQKYCNMVSTLHFLKYDIGYFSYSLYHN